MGMVPDVELFANELGCMVGSLPSSYLGMTLVLIMSLRL